MDRHFVSKVCHRWKTKPHVHATYVMIQNKCSPTVRLLIFWLFYFINNLRNFTNFESTNLRFFFSQKLFFLMVAKLFFVEINILRFCQFWYQLKMLWNKFVQSNLVIRNFLVTLTLFLNAKCSLSLWSKLAIGHEKWCLNTNLFLIKPFPITKFDCTFKICSFKIR
jgi:hypothetical protein